MIIIDTMHLSIDVDKKEQTLFTKLLFWKFTHTKHFLE